MKKMVKKQEKSGKNRVKRGVLYKLILCVYKELYI